MLFCIEIESWENDADHYKISRFFSPSEETVKWIQKYIQMFRCTNNNFDCYGNDALDDDILYEITKDFIDVNGLPEDLMNKTTKGYVRSFVHSLMGYSEGYGYNWIRALEKSEIKNISVKELNAYMDFKTKISD